MKVGWQTSTIESYWLTKHLIFEIVLRISNFTFYLVLCILHRKQITVDKNNKKWNSFKGDLEMSQDECSLPYLEFLLTLFSFVIFADYWNFSRRFLFILFSEVLQLANISLNFGKIFFPVKNSANFTEILAEIMVNLVLHSWMMSLENFSV